MRRHAVSDHLSDRSNTVDPVQGGDARTGERYSARIGCYACWGRPKRSGAAGSVKFVISSILSPRRPSTATP
jgi:hypothetical protein